MITGEVYLQLTIFIMKQEGKELANLSSLITNLSKNNDSIEHVKGVTTRAFQVLFSAGVKLSSNSPRIDNKNHEESIIEVLFKLQKIT